MNFRKFLVEGTEPNLKKIEECVTRSLMLVTSLSPVIGSQFALSPRTLRPRTKTGRALQQAAGEIVNDLFRKRKSRH
jgi:fumarate hydratase class II